MAILPRFSFIQYRPEKCLLRYSTTKRATFEANKNNKFENESRKPKIFPNGLTHGFGQKMAIFPSLFLKQYMPGKCVLPYSKTKKSLSPL